MNTTQRYVLIIAIIIIVLMGIYPPFYFRTYNGVLLNLGYGFVLNPPKVGDGFAGSVNVQLLMVQWLGVVIVAGIAALLTKTRSE